MNALAPAPRAKDYLEDPWEMMVYRAIRAAAEADQQFPRGDDLQELIGCEGISTTVNIIGRLEAKGLITRVERFQRTRRCFVPEVGKSTAQPANESPHWRANAVTIGDLRRDRVDEAVEIVAMADKMGIDPKAMLTRLVWAGWKVIQAERVGR